MKTGFFVTVGHLEHGDRKGDPGGEGFGWGLAVLKKGLF